MRRTEPAAECFVEQCIDHVLCGYPKRIGMAKLRAAVKRLAPDATCEREFGGYVFCLEGPTAQVMAVADEAAEIHRAWRGSRCEHYDSCPHRLGEDMALGYEVRCQSEGFTLSGEGRLLCLAWNVEFAAPKGDADGSQM